MRPLSLATRGMLSSQMPLSLVTRGILIVLSDVSDFVPFFIIGPRSISKQIALVDVDEVVTFTPTSLVVSSLPTVALSQPPASILLPIPKVGLVVVEEPLVRNKQTPIIYEAEDAKLVSINTPKLITVDKEG